MINDKEEHQEQEEIETLENNVEIKEEQDNELNDLLNLFTQNGYVIKNPKIFMSMVTRSNKRVNDILNELNSLAPKSKPEREKESSDSLVDYSESLIKVYSNLEEITKIYNNDEYTVYSDKEKVSNFISSLDNIRKKISIVKELELSKEQMTWHKRNLFDVKKKIYDLNNDSTLSDEERTSQTLRLYSEHKKCEEAYKKANNYYKEKTNEYTNYFQNTDIYKFKNELFNDLNVLDSSIKEIALSNDNKGKILNISSEMRNSIANIGVSFIVKNGKYEEELKEFNEKCELYGLARREDFIKSDANNDTQIIDNNAKDIVVDAKEETYAESNPAEVLEAPNEELQVTQAFETPKEEPSIDQINTTREAANDKPDISKHLGKKHKVTAMERFEERLKKGIKNKTVGITLFPISFVIAILGGPFAGGVLAASLSVAAILTACGIVTSTKTKKDIDYINENILTDENYKKYLTSTEIDYNQALALTKLTKLARKKKYALQGQEIPSSDISHMFEEVLSKSINENNKQINRKDLIDALNNYMRQKGNSVQEQVVRREEPVNIESMQEPENTKAVEQAEESIQSTTNSTKETQTPAPDEKDRIQEFIENNPNFIAYYNNYNHDFDPIDKYLDHMFYDEGFTDEEIIQGFKYETGYDPEIDYIIDLNNPNTKYIIDQIMDRTPGIDIEGAKQIYRDKIDKIKTLFEKKNEMGGKSL